MRRTAITPFKAGVLALVLIALFSYFGFTGSNPFSNPYELKASFRDVRNLRPGSPVRIAGVDVGEVTTIEAAEGDAATATMELDDGALPLHEDARLKIRPRILFEGNYFIDLEPGSPFAGELDDGDAVPVGQTATAVQQADIFAVLNSDARDDLRTLLEELGTKGLKGGGAAALNRAIRYMAPAYRLSALTNDALLGTQPTRDIPRLLRGQARTAAALSDNPDALKELVTDLAIVARALGSQDQALEAAVPALRDTLRAAEPALARVNAALPTLRAFSVEALPGVRSTAPTLDVAIPWIRQAAALVQEDELKGLAADLLDATPPLVRLNTQLVPTLRQLRALSSCINGVLVPFLESEIPSIEAGNSGHLVREQIQRSFVGLAGESRLNDANSPFFHIQSVPPAKLAGAHGGRIEPAAPLDPGTPPRHRPDVACETQEPPNLTAPGGPANLYSATSSGGGG
jgi:phospholipid/cholesterol/gamma-HCH transport system substrate-binding protein